MSVERDIKNELEGILESIRIAEQHIIGKDSSDKLEVVKKLVNLEELVKDIKNDISIPELEITEETSLETLFEEGLLSLRSKNCLLRARYRNIRDITRATEDDLLRVRNLGGRSFDEIMDFLKVNGFALKQSSQNKTEKELSDVEIDTDDGVDVDIEQDANDHD